MAQTYGIEASQAPRSAHPPRAPEAPAARYLVLIDAGSAGGRIARLFLSSLEEVAEFDAGAPEVQSMIDGLLPAGGARHWRWDRALAGHSAHERAGAEVYTLDT